MMSASSFDMHANACACTPQTNTCAFTTHLHTHKKESSLFALLEFGVNMLLYFSLVAGDLSPLADLCVGVLVIEVAAGSTTLRLSRNQEARAGVASLWSGLVSVFLTVSCKHYDSYL